MTEGFYETYVCGHIPSGLPGGFFIYEAGGDEKILFAELNVVNMYGCETYDEFLDFVGGSFKGMVYPDDLDHIQNEIQVQTMYGNQRHDYVRYRIITKQGKVRYVEDFGHLLHRKNGKSFYYVFIVDVDRNEFYNRKRKSVAEEEILSESHNTDSLTGLCNMSSFYQKTYQIMSSFHSNQNGMTIIHFDIPNFKLYNESHGFKQGDELLRELARTIREVFSDGISARFSNDHFFVFDYINQSDILNKVETVYNRMLTSKDVDKRVRVKVGIYYCNERNPEVGIACDHARLACNSIKRRHDVYYCVYDEILRDSLRRQQFVIDHIDEAIQNEYIKVYYQPVIRVKTQKICGYEALVRWCDPNIGLISPAQFIDTLEQFHLIHLVDKYVIKQVCEDYKQLAEKGEPLVPVSVNISRLDFELCDIFGYIEEVCAQFDVPRNMLDIEITESVLNDNVGHIKGECEKMKSLGYQIWLDDFGSGYSSLNSMTDYDFDVLKLDLVFLRNLDSNPKTGTLITHIINGARSLGLEPLCEGVETAQHYEFLKKAGCERAQGYYFGRPMPLDESRAYTKGKGLEWEQL